MARKMKDSGIEWIGEIPEGWEIKYFVQLFSQVKNKNIGLREKNLLSLSYGKIKQKSIETVGGLLPDNFEGYNIIDRNDIVLRLTDLQNDQHSLRVGLSPERGIITSAYCSIRVRGAESPNYLYYYLHTFDIAKGFYGMGSGVRQGLNWDGLKYIKILLPPQHEQDRISVFLNQKTLEIDSILSKTISSIEEYKKLKQAVITQAVTKGVRGEREMKDSGVEWIGEIPAEWKLSRVGLHFSIILGKMLCNAPLNDTYTLEPYYCAADVHFDGVADGERKKMWFSPIEKDLYRVSVGDLLVVEGGAGAGGSAIVEKQDSDTYVQNSIMIVRSKGNADNRYLRYLLEFLVKQGYIDVVCNKATIPHFTKDKLSCVPFCLCPTSEQKEIANYLDAKCAEIDKLIAKKEQLVKELESYKKSLIYEVVTGKREV